MILQISGLFQLGVYFPDISNYGVAQALSPSTPIYTVYRDAAWWEAIGTTVQTLSWDTVISEDPQIPNNLAKTNFTLRDGWKYLVMYWVPVQSSGWYNRSEVQSWLRINNAENTQYWYASSYIRRIEGADDWYNAWAAVINSNPWDTLEFQIQRTDTNTATVIRTPNRSGVNILKLGDSWNYARVRPSVIQTITTSWQNINLWVSDELDTGWYTQAWNDIILTDIGKYLITYNVAAENASGGIRMNDETRLLVWGNEVEWSRGVLYIRTANGSNQWVSSYVGVIETMNINQILNLQIRQESNTIAPDHTTVPSKTGLTITKLPDTADYARLWEIIGGQDITTAANTPLTFDTTLEEDNSFIHNTGDTSRLDIQESGDYLFLHSVYNTRTWTENGPRGAPFFQWQINGVNALYWVSWSYNRASNDWAGITNSSQSSAWVIFPWLSAGTEVRLTETNEAAAWSSLYTGSHMWLQAINLQSLFSNNPWIEQTHSRWRDNSVDFETDAGWFSSEDTPLQDIKKGETVRLRFALSNNAINPYTTDSRFELQWSENTGWTCNSRLTWESIATTWDAWEMVDTPFISPNAESSIWFLLANLEGNTMLSSEWYNADNGETVLVPWGTFNWNTSKEYEFSMRATEFSMTNSDYCFRLYNTLEDKPLDWYNYPQAHILEIPVFLFGAWWESWDIIAPENGAWTSITYLWGPYVDPIIVGRSNTHTDENEALVFEARNVTATSAEVRLCDSSGWSVAWCQNHGVETIGYVIVDADKTDSIIGVEAGKFSANESFDTLWWSIATSYSETFGQIPYVFTSVQTTNWVSPIVTRVSASSVSWFTWWICQQDSTDACNATHPGEMFGWIAIEPGINPFEKRIDIWTSTSTTPSDIWTTVSFIESFLNPPVIITQTVTNNGWQDVQIDEVQNITTTGMQFRSCEIDSNDNCDTHAIDDVRWFAIQKGVFMKEYFIDETHYRWYENNSSLTPTTPLADENMKLSTIPINNQLRLRMLLQNGDSEISFWILALKLQYANTSYCELASAWTDVWAVWWSSDWVMFDDPALTSSALLPSSLLFGGWHTRQTYNETVPTVTNPNSIPMKSWTEYDFSISKNVVSAEISYCFRVVTDNDNEIQYSSYAFIDTTDIIDPVISDYSPSDNDLRPIWDFTISYTYSDADSWTDTSSSTLILQRFNGVWWDSDISETYLSLDTINSTNANYIATGIPFGRYRLWFEIYDIAGNNTFIIHEFYVDEVEFIVSQAETDIWDIIQNDILYRSSDELLITVKTLWAGFNVIMIDNTKLNNTGDQIDDWDGNKWYGFELSPYNSGILPITGSNTLWSEIKNLNTSGEKNIYEYRIKYSALLEDTKLYTAWDYWGLIDFQINLSYE